MCSAPGRLSSVTSCYSYFAQSHKNACCCIQLKNTPKENKHDGHSGSALCDSWRGGYYLQNPHATIAQLAVTNPCVHTAICLHTVLVLASCPKLPVLSSSTAKPAHGYLAVTHPALPIRSVFHVQQHGSALRLCKESKDVLLVVGACPISRCLAI
jgi:hypothetical protein